MKAGLFIVAAATLLTTTNVGAVNLARDADMIHPVPEHGKRGADHGVEVPSMDPPYQMRQKRDDDNGNAGNGGTARFNFGRCTVS